MLMTIGYGAILFGNIHFFLATLLFVFAFIVTFELILRPEDKVKPKTFRVVLIAGAMQGYLIGIGDLTVHRALQWPIRVMLVIGGLAFAIPGGGAMPLDHGELFMLSLALTLPALIVAWLLVRNVQRARPHGA